MKRVVLPFTAIVGQEKLKRALLLNAINPRLYGVLIRGEKGTAKSTAVRGLAELLPEIDVVFNCPFNCSPTELSLQCDICNEKFENGEELIVKRRKMRVVELPLGATEDRVVGTLDIEKALTEGIKALQPGILADVNQGILYIDEVNLLDDHLVDILLDSAAMGVNVIEREGISVTHPARFILVGTMNPEEGELRPQLLDRFGLQAEIEGIKEAEERVEIIKVVEEFEANPKAFARRFEPKQRELRKRILRARRLLNKVTISAELLHKIAELCLEFDVSGHRADILIARTAKTIAAYNLRTEVDEGDIKEAAEFVLPHRMRKHPFEPPQPIAEKLEMVLGQQEEHHHEQESTGDNPSSNEEQERPGNREHRFDIGELKKAELTVPRDKKLRLGSGRRAQSLATHSGKYVAARIPQGKTNDIAIDATIRAAVARNGELKIGKQDIREKVRGRKTSSVIVFIVDASGSMGAMRRMEGAKGAALALLEEAYHKRDKVGFVAFRGKEAEVLLFPTSSVELAANRLRELPTGGKTPLPSGLFSGLKLIKQERAKNKNIVPIMVLISDGKGNVPLAENVRREVLSLAQEIKGEGINLLVLDSNSGMFNLGYNREIAEASGGRYCRLDELEPQEIVGEIKSLKGV
jgi:magnesium chelatase subunit D